jgi:riboflavin kinase/FMN adenylyltransferase
VRVTVPSRQSRRIDGASQLDALPGGSLVAIGNFDGVHRGHQAVLKSAFGEGRRRGLAPLVLTFDPHPSEVLGRGALPLLTTLERKVELITRLDETVRVVVEPFTHALAAQSPSAFAESLLSKRLGAALVIVGKNFRFGKGRAGDLDELCSLGEALGFEARAEGMSGDLSGDFSSTRARDAVKGGDLAEVAKVLGRPHSISGTVVLGQQRGRTIGFPTANLDGVREVVPPDGVYAVLVDVEAAPGAFRAAARGVMNLGQRPTLAAGRSIEVHLFDFEQDLYDKRLRVHLVERLRDERRFDGVEALRAQIALDATRARELLAPLRADTAADGAWA